MTPAVSTSADKVNNQITCTFTNNSDLYYDASCDYIDKTYCSTTTTPTNPSTETPKFDQVIVSASKMIFSIISLLAFTIF